MPLSQPIQVYFMGTQSEAAQIQHHLAPGVVQPSTPRANQTSKVKFGQRGLKPPIAPSRQEQSYIIQVQSLEDLRQVTNALSTNGKPGWVNVMTKQGPTWMQLEDFLKQSGLS